MRRRKKSEDQGFNVWRSYSDMMAGVLLLFVLIMCVTLFQAQKSYDESVKERTRSLPCRNSIPLRSLPSRMNWMRRKVNFRAQTEQIQSQDEKLKDQEQLLAALAAQLQDQEKILEEQAATLSAQKTDLDEKTALLADQQAQIDQIVGVKAEVIEALRNEFAASNVNVDIDSQTGALTLDANVMFDYDQYELTTKARLFSNRSCPYTARCSFRETIPSIWPRSS